LRRAFGRDLAFLYAWARATIINTGSIALLAFVFGDYFSTLVPLGAPSQFHASKGLGTCGDWHIGHRVEDAFVSGLELALAVCHSAHRL
jgi:hypothetical protein